MSTSQLPPTPRMPQWAQMMGWWTRPTAFLERQRRALGTPFTIKMPMQSALVQIADPDSIKQMFQAPPDVLHPGEGAKVLEPLIGANSVILLDEDAHLSQRRLVLPAFHGEKMEALRDVITEVSREEIESWPRGEELPLHPRLQDLTMRVILRTVFGLEEGERFAELKRTLTSMLEFGFSPVSLFPPAQKLPFARGALATFQRHRARADELIYAEIADRRATHVEGEGDDIVASFLDARHEDGSPMSDEEVHDELLTLLVAGHETTGSALSFALERLSRHPEVMARLTAEIDSGSSEYVIATIRETLRRRPVLVGAAPRKVKKEIEVGGITYPVGVDLFANAWLLHHDPEIYPDPYAFRPERFLGVEPGTYTWIPFGGGRRRCIGASFAMLEMQIVLTELLARTEVKAGSAAGEPTIRRAITITPGHAGRLTLAPRGAGVERDTVTA